MHSQDWICRKGFTLIELMIVVIIIGILATVALVNYGSTIEKGRVSEAKSALAEIRTAWNTYYLEHQVAPEDLDALELNPVNFPGPNACNEARFFRYDISDTQALAKRCTAGGKRPNIKRQNEYHITIELSNGTWGGTPGYY